jgi:thiol:disulfide interchange protein DsbD
MEYFNPFKRFSNMRPSAVFLFWASGLFVFVPSEAQSSKPKGLSFTVEPQSLSAAPGSAAVLTITIRQAEDVHLNSEPWPSLTFAEAAWLEAPKADITAAKKWSETLQSEYFTGTVVMRQALIAAPSAPAGEHRLKGTLTYYPCDDRTGLCYRLSEEVNLTFTVRGDAGSLAVSEAEKPGLAGRVVAILEGREAVGLPLLFALVFLVGIGTSFTPCVYPMIPITVGYFGARAGGSRSKTLARVGLYVLGIALVYAALGLLAATGGAAFGSLTQKPSVLFGVGVLMFIMALSMLGFFDLNLAFLQGVQGKPREGLAGAFMMGAVGGLVASPCVTPVLVALLTKAANSASPVFGFSLLFVFALGLGALLGLLAFFSSAVNFLPKSGAWMVGVKVFFGLLLLGVAVYYFTLAGETAGLSRSLPLLLSLGISLVLLGYLMDGLVFTQTPASGHERLKRASGFILVLAGAALLIQGMLELRPVRAASEEQSDGLWIRDDLDAALVRARAENKPLIMDFWAVWCVYCKEMDKTTLRDPEVLKIIRESLVAVKIDYDKNPEAARRYGIRGLPAVLIVAPDGSTELGRVSSKTGAEEMRRILRSALEKSHPAAAPTLEWES